MRFKWKFSPITWNVLQKPLLQNEIKPVPGAHTAGEGGGPCSLDALTCSCPPVAWHQRQGTGVAWLLSGTGGGGRGGQGHPVMAPAFGSPCPPRPQPPQLSHRGDLSCHLPAQPRDYGRETPMRGHTWGASLLGRDVRGCSTSPRDRASTLGGCSLAGGAHTKRGPPGQAPPFSAGPAPVRPWAPGCCQAWRLQLYPSHCVGQTCFSFF